MTTITTIGRRNIKAFQGILPQVPAGDDVFRFGLIDNGSPVAAVELNNSEGICEITSIFVVPQKRRKQYGRACIMAAERVAKQNKMVAIRASYCTDKEISDFFSFCGFVVEDGDAMIEVSKNAFVESKKTSGFLDRSVPSSVRSLSALNKKEVRSLEKMLENNGYETFISKVPYCLQDLSKVHMSKEGNVDACFLADGQEDSLFITLMLNTSGRESVLLGMMSGLNEAVTKGSYDFNRICFFAEDSRIPELLKSVLEDENAMESRILTQNAVKMLI